MNRASAEQTSRNTGRPGNGRLSKSPTSENPSLLMHPTYSTLSEPQGPQPDRKKRRTSTIRVRPFEPGAVNALPQVQAPKSLSVHSLWTWGFETRRIVFRPQLVA